MVECEIIGLDKYRRLLGTCSILDVTSKPDGPSLNERMVAAGLALAYTRFSQTYVGVETEARAARRGLWQGPFEMPWDVRARQKAERGDRAPLCRCHAWNWGYCGRGFEAARAR